MVCIFHFDNRHEIMYSHTYDGMYWSISKFFTLDLQKTNVSPTPIQYRPCTICHFKRHEQGEKSKVENEQSELKIIKLKGSITFQRRTT